MRSAIVRPICIVVVDIVRMINVSMAIDIARFVEMCLDKVDQVTILFSFTCPGM